MFKRMGGGGVKGFLNNVKKLHFSYSNASLSGMDGWMGSLCGVIIRAPLCGANNL